MARSYLRLFFALPPVSTPGLTINALGVGEPMVPCIVDRPQGTGDHLIMVFHQETVLGPWNHERIVPPGTLILWKPSSAHRYGCPKVRWKHSWMHLDGAFLTGLIADCGIPCDLPILDVPPSILEDCALGIHGEIATGAIDHAIIESHLRILFHRLRRLIDRSGASQVPLVYQEVRSHIETAFDTPLGLSSLAARVGCSIPHFCSRFHACFGISPIAYLIQVRLACARMLLQDRNRSVADVAQAVGYHDVRHFSKLFRKHLGCAPSRARIGFPGQAVGDIGIVPRDPAVSPGHV